MEVKIYKWLDHPDSQVSAKNQVITMRKLCKSISTRTFYVSDKYKMYAKNFTCSENMIGYFLSEAEKLSPGKQIYLNYDES